MKSITLTFCLFMFAYVNTYSQCTTCNNPIPGTTNYASKVGTDNIATGNNSFAGGITSRANGAQSFAFGSAAIADGANSFALGWGTLSNSNFAVSIGTSDTASGVGAMVLGTNSRAGGTGSLAMGNFVQAMSNYSMVIGTGFQPTMKLRNSNAETLMIGFNSIKPTLSITTSVDYAHTGKVCIGNVLNVLGILNPQAKLHIKADDGEAAAIFIQPFDWSGGDTASLVLGNQLHGISANERYGLFFRTQSFYNFNEGYLKIGKDARIGSVLACIDGVGTAKWVDPLAYSVWSLNIEKEAYRMSKVGILTETPETELDVIGTVKMSGLRLQNMEAQIGRVLSCRTTTGEAIWVDPANFSIWQLNDHGDAYRMSKVGVGTDEPKSELDVNGNISVNDAIIGKVGTTKWVDPDFLTLLGSDNEYASKIMIPKGNNANHQAIKIISPAQGGEIQFFAGGALNTIIRQNEFLIGKVDTPMELKVTGKIWAHEVEVKLDAWWDEVFDEDYSLMPLLQLEKFIADNNHLPDMPTEETVLKDGIELGEMNALLLKKVEELTLYVIELKKELDEVKQQQTSN